MLIVYQELKHNAETETPVASGNVDHVINLECHRGDFRRYLGDQDNSGNKKRLRHR